MLNWPSNETGMWVLICETLQDRTNVAIDHLHVQEATYDTHVFRTQPVKFEWIPPHKLLAISGQNVTQGFCFRASTSTLSSTLSWRFRVIKSGTNRKLVYDFLLVYYSNFCRHAPFLGNLMWNSIKTLKYRQSHQQSHHVKGSSRVAMYEHVRKTVNERSENRHFQRPHSHLTPPPQGTPTNICINLILPETTFPGLHFCRWR